MNNSNLKPFTKETAKENGRKGGLASVKARKERKGFRYTLNELLSMSASHDEIKKELIELGLEEDEILNETLIVYKLYIMALNGDIKAIRTIMDITGDLPPKQLQIKTDHVQIDKAVQEMEEYFKQLETEENKKC